MSKIIKFFLVLLCFVVKLNAQENSMDLNLKFNKDAKKIRLLKGDSLIHPDDKNHPAFSIDLTKNDLHIKISDYTDSVKIKFIPEVRGLSCEGFSAFTDTNTPNKTISIIKGLLLLDKDIQLGTSFKIVLPDSDISWTITGTNLTPLSRCPDVLAGTSLDPVDSFKVGLIYYDAIRLKNTTDVEVIKRILKYYTTLRDSSNIYKSQIADSLQKNLFLKDIATRLKSSADDHATGSSASSFSLSSLAGLDVTNIADGFAKFIVKRTKQELSIAFFEKFKKQIEKYPDIKTVFPNTYNLLEAIGDEIYNYSNYINNLREAFRSDLQTIDENLPGIVDNHPNFFKEGNNFILGLALRTGCYVSTSLRHDMHPGDILSTYPIDLFGKSPNDTLIALKGAIQSLQLLSESLREDNADTSKHSYWVGIDKIRQLVDDKDVLKIYLGLLLQVANLKYSNIQFTSDKNFYSLLNTEDNVKNFDTAYPAYRNYILTFGSKVNELNKMIKEYKQPDSDSLKVEQIAKYFKSSVQFLHYCVQVTKLPFLDSIPVNPTVNLNNLDKITGRYFNIAFETADLTTAINRKRYSEVINHLVVVYDEVVAKPALYKTTVFTKEVKMSHVQRKQLVQNFINANISDSSKKTYAVKSTPSNIEDLLKSTPTQFTRKQIKNITLVISENAKDSNSTIKDVVKKLEETSGIDLNVQNIEAINSHKVLAALAKYGAFMSSLINAQTSDEVASAIEAVALPVGSAKIKRESPFNVSLNAYCGLFIGNEVIKDVDHRTMLYGFNSSGLTAPIGISVSRGKDGAFPFTDNREKRRHNWSHSFFISLIDLGAVTAYRFTNETAEQVPTIQLKDIFSPGIFWSIGIAKTPLSINFGAQVGPNLRKVTIDKNDYSGHTYSRYSISVCVDLPLLNLYTKSR